jgi:carboxyl-terminal processing protease
MVTIQIDEQIEQDQQDLKQQKTKDKVQKKIHLKLWHLIIHQMP